MPDLEYRFDDTTEEYCARQLVEVREFARTVSLPGDLALEIGSNRGRFLLELARRAPDRVHLGVELRFKYAKLARRDLRRHGIENAHVVCADAALLLPVAIDDGQLAEMFLLYPDPWWKQRHRKRRVIRPDFLDLLARKMRSGGRVWIRTDVGPLADDMRDTLLAHPEFEPVAPEQFPLQPFPRSTRERHWVAAKNPVNLVYFSRR